MRNIEIAEIQSTGVVKFRIKGTTETFNGTREICRYAGTGKYIWDEERQVCVKKVQPQKAMTTTQSRSIGTNNKISKQSDLVLLTGQNNVVNDDVTNSIIIGEDNKIGNNVNNTQVFGKLGHSKSDGTLVLGGGKLESGNGEANIGQVQTIHAQLCGQATSTSASQLSIYAETDNFIHIPKNCVGYIQADILGQITASEEDDLGKHYSTKIEAIFKSQNDGVITISPISTITPEIKPVAFGFFQLFGATNKAQNLSATRVSTGIFTMSFTNSLPDANYVVIAQIHEPDGNRDDIKIHVKDGSQSTANFTLHIYEGDNGGNPDTSRDRAFSVVVFDTSVMSTFAIENLPILYSPSENNLTVRVYGRTDKTINWTAGIKLNINRTNTTIG